MAVDWQIRDFVELYAVPSRNGLTKPKRIRGKGYKFINMGELFAHERMLNITCDRVPATEKELASSTLEPGDLLFARQSLVLSGAGKCSIFLGDDETVVFESHLIRVRVDQEIIEPQFLFYYFNSPIGKSEIWSITEQGAGQAGIRGSDLEKVRVTFPSLYEQKAIVAALSAFDHKIELNRRMNATLEAMAQALFKSWFVDFDPVVDNALAAGNPIPEPLQARADARKALGDQRKPLPEAIQNQFPDRFVLNDELGWVPEGWEVLPLDSQIELIGGGTPKTSIEEYWGGDIPWFSVVDAPNSADVFVIDTEKHTTQAGLDNSSAKLMPVGTTIISARGTVGKCAVIGKPMAMNQSCYGVRAVPGYGDYFTYFTVLLRVADLQKRSHGSVFSTITRDTFRSLKSATCPAELSMEFDLTISSFMDKILSNLKLTECLSKTRDTLLPKLLSGQLRVSDIEHLTARVT